MSGQHTTSFIFSGDPITEQVDEESDFPQVNLNDLMLTRWPLLERREINGVTLCVRQSPYLNMAVIVVETFCYITPQRAFGQRHIIPTEQYAKFTPVFRHEMFAAFAEQCLLDAERAKNAPKRKERPSLPLPHHQKRRYRLR